MEIEFLEIIAQQRFAAGETHGQGAQVGGLPQDALPLFRAQFLFFGPGVIFGEIDAAVDAIVVAALGEFDVKMS